MSRLDEILRIMSHYGADGRGEEQDARAKLEGRATLFSQFSRVTPPAC